jgi:LPS-assembly protein
MLGKDQVMCSRYFWCITLLLLCHVQMEAQLLTNALPSTGQSATGTAQTQQRQADSSATQKIPDDPSLQVLPVARPEPPAQTGVPVRWEAEQQTRVDDVSTLTGQVVFYYKNYVIHADKVVYHHATSTVEAEGHLQLEGGPDDAVLTASHGEMHLDDHTAALYDVTGTFGVRRVGRALVYSTPDPFIFQGRILLQTGEQAYRIVDGSMTSCRLPKPDWQLISRSIVVANNQATTHNSVFQFWRIPLFYLPFVTRNLDDTGRESGFLLPGGENSGVKGLVIGDEVYWVINRSMDLTVGAEYWSKRGFAPTGSFRYRGPGLDALAVRWDALLDRGIEQTVAGATEPTLVNQGGADITAYGRKFFTPETRLAGIAEYLSSYIYRLTFDENLAQATSSEVQSDVALTHTHHAFISSLNLDRFESFSGTTSDSTAPVVNVPEVRLLHLPVLRFDVADRPLLPGGDSSPSAISPVYWGLGSSIGDFDRAEPHFHARNAGRLDIYPHVEWPVHLGDWNILPSFALRTTQYSGSELQDLAGTHFDGVPFVQHNPLNRSDVEAAIDIRPTAIERDFELNGLHRELRHVIEPEIFYRYVTGINNAQKTLQFDTADIATNTNEAGYSLTQRFYLRRTATQPCNATEPDLYTFNPALEKAPNLDPLGAEVSYPSSPSDSSADGDDATCKPPAREWASWQIAQKFYINPNFGGAVIDNRRNVFDATLDMTGVAFLTSPRNIAPILSRMRFEAIDRLRVEWDLDYDPKAGRITASNLFAGYSFGRTTIGIGHAALDAVEENNGKATTIQGQQVKPFLYFGRPTEVGLSVALNASYDFYDNQMQYEGVEAVYNWNCCGLQAGYRRFSLGSLRDEGEWLWGFTLSSIGTAGNIRRSTSVFPTPAALRLSY